jgi:hypothetical protein
MRTSKQLFQSSAAFKEFQTMLASPSFEPACHAALASFVESLPTSTAEPSKSWDAHCQIVGARRVLEILSTLHEPDTTPTPQKWPTLKYDDGTPKPRP